MIWPVLSEFLEDGAEMTIDRKVVSMNVRRRREAAFSDGGMFLMRMHLLHAHTVDSDV